MGKPKIVGIGELLWDVLPAGRRLGGAPVNFAFYAQEQGAEACIVSAVGQDASGDELLGGIAALGLGVRAVQRNAHPTSTVEVTLDAAGVPAYRIREQVAWDYIERTAEADAAVAGAAVVCWGSLAQRNAVSRRTILALVDAAPVGCLRLFDINLRLNYYDERIVRDSLERADILKLNEDELPVVARFFGLEGAAERVVAQLFERFSLRYVVFTEGGRGSRVTAADGRTSPRPASRWPTRSAPAMRSPPRSPPRSCRGFRWRSAIAARSRSPHSSAPGTGRSRRCPNS